MAERKTHSSELGCPASESGWWPGYLEYEKGMQYADILRFAMKREEKALKLYNEMQTKTQDKDYIRLFKILAQEEAKHKQFLEVLYDDYMAEQGD